jgi:hypothetical protein
MISPGGRRLGLETVALGRGSTVPKFVTIGYGDREATMAEAVEIVSRTPCAVAHGVVEVWPL